MPLVEAPLVGDTLTVRDGCARTRAACMAHGQILNIRAFPEVPGTQALKPAIPAQGSGWWREGQISGGAGARPRHRRRGARPGSARRSSGASRKKASAATARAWSPACRELGRPEADSFYATFRQLPRRSSGAGGAAARGLRGAVRPGRNTQPGDMLLLKHAGSPGTWRSLSATARSTPIRARRKRQERAELEVLFHKFPLHSIWRGGRCR
jgi:hypothetical protein